MVRTTLVAAAATASLAGAVPSRAEILAATPSRAPVEDCRRVESERFVFHSDPWIGLHHFLFQWARNQAPGSPRDRRRAVEVPEQAQLGALEGENRRAWEEALAFYREEMVERDLLFDRDLVALRGQLAAVACSATDPERVDSGLWRVLKAAMPAYRQQWWPEQHAANRAWISGLRRDLERFETPVARRLAAAYDGEWPEHRIRVDVVAYANWAGAYTTNEPDQVTISGRDYEGLEGVEILFHEVSHASFFEQRMLGQLAAAFRRHGSDPPDRLSHVLQFVTPAELLRTLLPAEERAGARLIADRMAERRRARDQYQVVLEHWKPFLDGQLERSVALDRIAAELVR